MTSRPYDDIASGFQYILTYSPTIRLSGEKVNDQIHEEIDLVIQERVKVLADKYNLSSLTKDGLERWLLRMEHRTHLWLHLTMESIESKY